MHAHILALDLVPPFLEQASLLWLQSASTSLPVLLRSSVTTTVSTSSTLSLLYLTVLKRVSNYFRPPQFFARLAIVPAHLISCPHSVRNSFLNSNNPSRYWASSGIRSLLDHLHATTKPAKPLMATERAMH